MTDTNTAHELVVSEALTYAAEMFRDEVYAKQVDLSDKPRLAELWNDRIDWLNKNGDVTDHEAFHCPAWAVAMREGVQLAVPSCDPQEALEAINDEGTLAEIREECVDELAKWLAGGGLVFINAGNISEEAMGWLEGTAHYGLAAAIRVAIANSDLSGLEGLGYEVAR